MTWTTDPTVLPATEEENFKKDAAPVTLVVDAGTGTVIVQVRDSGGSWATMETLGSDGWHKIDVANCPAINIDVTGDAQYKVLWS